MKIKLKIPPGRKRFPPPGRPHHDKRRRQEKEWRRLLSRDYDLSFPKYEKGEIK